ncbi:MAG TPA: hypothetical protein VMF89_02870, partial [Polyangiales bacterium]|nr:hypothetical protein [Polyangiales bacterium]
PVHRDEKVYNYRALASIPKDGPVLQLRTPQGLIVDPSSEIDEQNAETPLEGAVVHEIDPEKETLNTIEERITAPPPAPGKK